MPIHQNIRQITGNIYRCDILKCHVFNSMLNSKYFCLALPMAELSVLLIRPYIFGIRNKVSKGMSDLFVNSNGLWHFLGLCTRFEFLQLARAVVTVPRRLVTVVCTSLWWGLRTCSQVCVQKGIRCISRYYVLPICHFRLRRRIALRRASCKSIYAPNHRVERK